MTTPEFPPGPQLVYVTDVHGDVRRFQIVDRQPPEDPRDRAICRALLLHALALLDASETARGSQP